MSPTKAVWLLIVLAVTALNTWAAYMTAVYGLAMSPHDAAIIGMFAGFITYVLARAIVA